MDLNEKEWKSFKIEDIFIVDKGKYLNKKNIIKGNIPHITAKATNNGINDFIGNGFLFPKNSITIEKVSLSSFYQPHCYYCSHDVSVIQNSNFDKYVSLFICTMIKRQGAKYSYGRQAQKNVIRRETVYLPTDVNENPDWQFMREYIKEQAIRKIKIYKIYIDKVLSNLTYENIPKLVDKKWIQFNLIDLFPEIQRGKRLTKTNQKSGKIPYISSSSLTNGVDNFISNSKNVRKFYNCISLANSGSVGSCFYEPYEFIASDHVTHLKNNKMNKYIYLFIACMLNRLSEKYNFNREINDERISREKIILPVNDKNMPDYKYMEQYIKNLMIKKYDEYIAFND